MDILNSIIFISENSKYIQTLDDIDEFTMPQDILRRKIKSDPFNRNLLKRKSREKRNLNSVDVPKNNFSRNVTVDKKCDNTNESNSLEKNYIKNLTGSPIIILTNEICDSGRNKGFQKAIEIVDFKYKKELSESELKNEELLRLYETGKITDVTKSERDIGMKAVWKEKQKFIQLKENAIDDNIVDPVSKTAKRSSSGISRVSDRGKPESIVDKVNRGELYEDTNENTIEINPETRGPSLGNLLETIESSIDLDGPMTESEMRKFMGG